MNYRDVLAWPDIPVEEIDRGEIETMHSLTHYDGPYDGLVRYRGKVHWATRFSYEDYRWWVIELTDEQADAAVKRAEEWAHLFSTHCKFNPDGTRVPSVKGQYNTDRPFAGTQSEYDRNSEFRKRWDEEHPIKMPDKAATVVGYFTSWRNVKEDE